MKCFFHSADLDGHCSGAIVKHKYPDCEMIGINYGQEFPWDTIEKGEKVPVITVGNLNAKRDFTDVRDVVRAYWLAATKGKPGEVYNICSGKTIVMKEILNMLLEKTDKKIEIKTDPKKLRPSDVEVLLGDSSKFSKETGWKPEIEFGQTLEDLLSYWREKTK